MRNYLVLLITTLTILINSQYRVLAQDSSGVQYRGTIIEILEETTEESRVIYQKLLVRLSNKENVEVENKTRETGRNLTYRVGDKVILQSFEVGETQTMFITDYDRTGFLIFIFAVFTILSVMIGKKHGLYSVVGMIFSFFIIFKFMLPQIVSGKNPIIITILTALLITPITFYLSHGFNKKTHVSIFSTGIALILTSILTSLSISLAKLTGYSTEEAVFLQVSVESINMKGILLSGIIIGLLGILDDVTVSQSSTVMQLKKLNPNMGTLELYQNAMVIGRDHITSMINTLVLVYAGAAMPLLLLFSNSQQPALFVVNMESVSEEIIRTLLGSIGLIMVVPISTFFAAVVAE
ncbi:YibE/F family protein [candidate division WWE3 bacterium]|jgi:uncharacterized membrane protein|uniref:YibE/F family protein n=1 Tax=candidate division WWE3 bacterium TaxID=2053526 RepID=A0A3A4ZE08_UNCKA|nr:MAG: YibE/F family protein [candidate division WWE3 bacterium]